MSQPTSSPEGLMPSVLDRLIDPESSGTAWRHGYGVEQMTAVIHRDLEDLLNTRQTHGQELTRFPVLEDSILHSGLPDLASLAAVTVEQRQAIARVLEASVARHEPRLRDIHASLLDEEARLDRTVRFRIEAKLCVDPAPAVAFDALLELTTGRYTVTESAPQ
jgi:type VI secretion system protein ImpF